jgi:hypothetical protein
MTLNNTLLTLFPPRPRGGNGKLPVFFGEMAFRVGFVLQKLLYDKKKAGHSRF